ncbi:MAG: AraC family transcriptional regulator [Chitinophagaceae bacterium]|nr:MAG: AraC family transcriptional regulator [Chitinophagaceae bacterium]
MADYQVHITRLHSDHSFQHFAASISGELSPQNLITINPSMGKGFIRKVNPEDGLSVRLWNVILNQPTRLFKHAVPATGSRGFNLVYIITPEYCQLKTIGTHTQFNNYDARTSYLLADDVAYDFEIAAFHPIQVIDLSVSSEWLKLQFEKRILPFPDLWERTVKTDAPFVFSDICSTTVNLTINELFEIIIHDGTRNSVVRSLVVVLVAEFFKKMFNRQPAEAYAIKDVHFEKIMEAENILLAHLQKNLPSLEQIAKSVALSESTFKRHFKAIFGKSIYEYYLEKKMDLAKQLMLENALSVNDTAERLGYEKVSNFIEIFKKHHGYSPGVLKKKRTP